MLKTLCLIAFVVSFLYNLLLLWLRTRSEHNPIPDTVKDVYDAESYNKWKRYNAEQNRFGLVRITVVHLVSFLLLLTNAYAAVALPMRENPYVAAILVVVFYQFIGTLVELPFDYYLTMRIEEKYGFNRTDAKTFWLDQVKNFLLGLIPIVGLLCLFVLLHQTLGDWVLLLSGIILFVFILFISFLSPFFLKIFNKFTPLPDGELRTKLTALLEGHGYKVRAIQVMDASKRSSKSNAFFTGFGRMKAIVLYDTLLESFSDNEICAVFAHEMGHGLHKDTLKMQLLNILTIAILALFLWLNVRTNAVSTAFGFDRVNYGFALVLLFDVEMAFLSPLMDLLRSWFSRRHEYRADAQAVSEGYGEPLIAGLKKLNRENLGDLSPSPLLVKLTYSHPTLDQRIRAIQKAK